MALVLIGAVADFAEPVEEYGAAECILLRTIVEADVATTTQLGVQCVWPPTNSPRRATHRTRSRLSTTSRIMPEAEQLGEKRCFQSDQRIGNG